MSDFSEESGMAEFLRTEEEARWNPDKDLDWYFLRYSALSKLRRHDEAEATLAEAIDQFPDDPWLAIHHGWTAMGRADWREAVRRWDTVRDRFPDQPVAYSEGGMALREAGRVEEAEAVLATGAEKFPDDAAVLYHYALNADRRKSWAEALVRWEHLRRRFPDGESGRAELDRARNVSHSELAEEVGAVLERAAALTKLEQLDQAEAVLAEGMTRYPDHVSLAVHHGWTAMSRADWQEAARRWEAIRDRFPDQAVAFYEGGLALREAGRVDEAEALLAVSADLFPDNVSVLHHYALNAAHRRSWAEALARWEVVCERFPDDELGRAELGRARNAAQAEVDNGASAVLEKAAALAKLDRRDEAEAALAEGMGRFPNDPRLAVHHSWMAAGRADWQEAVRRWETIRDSFPDQPTAYAEGGMALREAGRVEEAEALLAAGVDIFPDNAAVLTHFALNADRRRSWVEALARWEHLCARFPDDEVGKKELQRVRYEAQLDGVKNADDILTEPIGDSTPLKVSVTGRESDASLEPSKLLLRFESLGDNCEFGFVQRHFGAEPLSLFRWGATTVDMLTSALDGGFEGIGEIEHTTFSVYPSGELVLHDEQYFNSLHTHVYQDSVDLDTFAAEMCQRLRFLKKRMIKTLAEADKIFVRRSRMLYDEEAHKLLAALRRYGDNRLVCICSPDENNPSGGFERRTDNFAVGYVKLEDRPDQKTLDYEGWVEICRKAYSAFNIT